jgi:hypothetical protein
MSVFLARDVQAASQAPPTRRGDAEAEKVRAVDLGMTALDDARAQRMLQASEADRLALQEVQNGLRRPRPHHPRSPTPRAGHLGRSSRP